MVALAGAGGRQRHGPMPLAPHLWRCAATGAAGVADLNGIS